MNAKMPESEKKKKVCIALDNETHERIKEYAKQQHMSVSQAITSLIWDAELKSK